MQQDSDIEQRLLIVEQKIKEMEQREKTQSDINMGLLLRTDLILGKVQDVKSEMNEGFKALMAGQKDLEASLTAVTATLADHREAIESLASGQRQIIALLTGNTGQSPLND